MVKDLSVSDGKHRKGKALLAVVGLGMVLFIFGFLLTVTSLSGPGTASSDAVTFQTSDPTAETASLSLFFGLLLSLGGLVLATAGPAMMFIHARRASGRDMCRSAE